MKNLESLLIKRLATIADTTLRDQDPEAQLAALQSVSEAIDAWKQEHYHTLHPRLQHYLDGYSLQKALDFIQSEGNTASPCSTAE